MVKSDFLPSVKSSLIGQGVYSIAAGVCGILLIVLFLTGLMPVSAIVVYMPWIVGFNGLMSGYTLMDRTRDRISHPRAAGAGAGFLVGLLACTVLNLLALYTVGTGLIYGSELLFFTIIATTSGGLGAILAIKYLSLNNVKS